VTREIVPTLDVEQLLWCTGVSGVVGVDEAGIGPIAGPVVAAAVRLDPMVLIVPGIRDSKMLSASRRESLLVEILRSVAGVGVGAASVEEIGRLNVRRASHLAMARALTRVGTYDHVLVDGNPIRDIDLGPHTTIVDGDATSYAIACASIVAKVSRDRLMLRLARRYPAYGWDHNAGYPTAEHLLALRSHGVTPYHRTGFAPVRALLEPGPSEESCE
jgi:ribonuclease HII